MGATNGPHMLRAREARQTAPMARNTCTIRHSRYQPNGLHVGILLTNVCRLEILVDDESYERVDITKWFWELYKDQGDTPGFG